MQQSNERNTAGTTALPVLKPSDILSCLVTMIEVRRPVMVVGSPGVGKSRIMEGAGREVAEGRGLAFAPHNTQPAEGQYGYLDVRATLLDPVDLRGLPSVEGGMTRWNTPVFLPQSGQGVLCLDEVNAAPLSVQTALYQLILDRRLGEYMLPDGWAIIGAGNRLTDGGTALKMPTPMSNRFVHLEMGVDVEDWSNWALGAGVEPMVVAFMRFRPHLLHLMPGVGERAFPTPRSWEFVSEVVRSWGKGRGRGKDKERGKSHLQALIAGAVGMAAGIEFSAFVDLYEKLPDLDSIIADPERAPVPSPTDPGTRYAIAFALANRCTKVNIGQVIAYLDRMPEEYAVLSIKAATTRNTELTATKEFVRWATRHADAFTG